MELSVLFALLKDWMRKWVCMIALFSKQLVAHVSQAREEASSEKPFKGCSYIAPLDSLFSGLKRDFYFPSHKLILSFADRELYGMTIYKKPHKGIK